jgi:hypothetical protein
MFSRDSKGSRQQRKQYTGISGTYIRTYSQETLLILTIFEATINNQNKSFFKVSIEQCLWNLIFPFFPLEVRKKVVEIFRQPIKYCA